MKILGAVGVVTVSRWLGRDDVLDGRGAGKNSRDRVRKPGGRARKEYCGNFFSQEALIVRW